MIPAWASMWLLAAAVWLPLKTLLLVRSSEAGRRTLLWFLWPGTDTAPFLAPGPRLSATPPFHRGLQRLAEGLLLLVLSGALLRSGAPPRAATLVGLVGVVLALHFGVFDLLATAFRRRGIEVSPLMDAPLRAESLGELWGRRWNRGFSIAARDLLFRPLARHSPPVAAFLVFLASGLLHELVLSVPARGGYGGPTAYFLVQWAGATLQRTGFAAKARLDRGVGGRLLTAAVALLPLGLLLRPEFLDRVAAPMVLSLTGGA